MLLKLIKKTNQKLIAKIYKIFLKYSNTVKYQDVIFVDFLEVIVIENGIKMKLASILFTRK